MSSYTLLSQDCKLPPGLTEEVIKSNFNDMFFYRGKKYHEEGRVKINEFDQLRKNQWSVSSEVKGSKPGVYEVDILIEQKGNRFNIHGDCDCPININCKHVVATLLMIIAEKGRVNTKDIDFHYLRRGIQYSTNGIASKTSQVDKWLNDISRQNNPIIKNEKEYQIFYEFSQSTYSQQSGNIYCQPILFKLLKSGLRSKSRKRYLLTGENQIYFTPDDRTLIGRLEVELQLMGGMHMSDAAKLHEETGEMLIENILKTGRGFWTGCATELRIGDNRDISFHWHTLPDGTQKFQHDHEPSLHVFCVKQLWYLDTVRNEMGRVNTDISSSLFMRIVTMPPIPPLETKKFCESLKKILPDVPRPAVYRVRNVSAHAPVPCLHLAEKELKVAERGSWSYKSVRMPLAAVSFRYGSTEVPWEDSRELVHVLEQEGITQYKRDFTTETTVLNNLVKSHRLKPLALDEYVAPESANNFALGHEPMAFTLEVLPKLRDAGWHIDMHRDYPYDILDIDMNEWYANLDEEGSGIEWFNLELGVLLPSGEKINLLPILQRYLLNPPQANVTKFMTRLDDGRKVSLPVQRLQKAASVLIDIFNRTTGPVDQLKLSRLEAMRLAELQNALNAAKMRWHGGQKLLEIAHKLSRLESLEDIPLPEMFHGRLRPYQQSGLNWLQFLRENQFSGILADDMGLGKTIQAISHITVEKHAGRLQKPVLIIAPTSLMYNWQSELQRFSPDLNVLLLHGALRKQYHAEISCHDVVLTTYPLLLRDKDVLLKHQFHLLILDEAQAIKNFRTQAAQIVIQIRADNRICMTGTPMENHLGELWSLFHFMMPGLLGTEKHFRTLFRYPIEKNQDENRRQLLARIVSPFLLRRKKNDVAKELPDKIEIMQPVEMEAEQRDLYETIRLSMQKKLRDTIKKMGLARSHIMILDALLKLRQICCDPRLLKTEKKSRNLHSAKLAMLMSMLPEMVEEGRKILLFSQFTEMLDLIKQELDAIQLPYVTLTGKTRDRKSPILDFQSGKAPIFLISLKAGGTGLNLTAADTVIHYDPWWNPAVENQATDRAHRIGQEKKVFVYRFVTKGTVEEKIIELQQRKHALAESLLNSEGKGSAAFSMEDLQMLLGEG